MQIPDNVSWGFLEALVGVCEICECATMNEMGEVMLLVLGFSLVIAAIGVIFVLGQEWLDKRFQ